MRGRYGGDEMHPWNRDTRKRLAQELGVDAVYFLDAPRRSERSLARSRLDWRRAVLLVAALTFLGLVVAVVIARG
jgi:hypothetical protein